MSDINSCKKLDRRTIGRYINKGMLSKEEYEAHLKSLPDEESNGEWVKLDLVDAEITDDDIDEDEDEEEDETY
jgi:hypothetical protein